MPRQLVYDNLKSACVEREGRAIRFNESLLELASHYGFEPIVASPGRGNEKGRVERTIRYIRTSFFAARAFRDIDDLNAQALVWTKEVSAARRWQEDDRTTVRAQFGEERSSLKKLPDQPYEAVERIEAHVGRTPFVRFDKNDYSLPCAHVRRRVRVVADPQRVRVVVDGEVVAEHVRSYDRRATIEDPAHLRELIIKKRRAKEGAGMSRLTRAAPAAQVMLERAAQRGLNIGGLVAKLLELLDMYGASLLDEVLAEVNATERVGPSPVRLALEAKVRAQGRTVPRPVELADHRLRDLVVERTDLSLYDQLAEADDAEDS